MIASYLPPDIAPLDIEVSRLRKSYGPEPVTVEGLVSMQPQSVVDGPMGAPYRVHYIELDAWRIVQGAMRTEPLTVLRAIPRSKEFKFGVAAASLLSMRVLLSETGHCVSACNFDPLGGWIGFQN